MNALTIFILISTTTTIITVSASVAYCDELSPFGIPTAPVARDYFTDFGNVNHTIPSCVVLPRNAIEIQAIIYIARKFQAPISVRGKATSTAGQTQSPGIVIDTSFIQTLQLTEKNKAVKLGAGISWDQASFFVDQVTNSHFRLAFAPDFVSELNVAGIVSVGGLSSFSLRSGSVLDYVEEIEVVTGKGEIIRANDKNNTEIFFATKGGLGQFSVIVSVTIPIVPLIPLTDEIDTSEPFAGIPEGTALATIESCKLLEIPTGLPYVPHIMTYTLLWTDPTTFYEDLTELTNENSADGFESFLLPNSIAHSPLMELLLSPLAVSCLIDKEIIGNSDEIPYLYFGVISDFAPLFDVAELPGIVSGNAIIVQGSALPWVNIPGIKGYVNSSTFYGYEARYVPFMELTKNFRFWNSPKYNFNMFLPLYATMTKEWFVKLMTETLPEATDLHPNTFFMIEARAFFVSAISWENLFQVPREEITDFVFHPIITMFVKNCDPQKNAAISVGSQCASDVEFMSQFTDELYGNTLHQFQEFLPKFYPIGGAPYSWQEHYGSVWDTVQDLKCKYDPDVILGSGVGIFRDWSCDSSDTKNSAPIIREITLDLSNPTQSQSESSLGLIVIVSFVIGLFLVLFVLGTVFYIIRMNTSGVKEIIVEVDDSVQLYSDT